MLKDNKNIIKWSIFCIICLILIIGLVNAVKDVDKSKVNCDKDITKQKLKESSWDKFQVCEYTSPLTNKTWTIIRHK